MYACGASCLHVPQVYAVDPRFIDPRRPKKAKLSTEDIEERLLPYQDTLPINSQGFVSFDKQVRRECPHAPTHMRVHVHECEGVQGGGMCACPCLLCQLFASEWAIASAKAWSGLCTHVQGRGATSAACMRRRCGNA